MPLYNKIKLNKQCTVYSSYITLQTQLYARSQTCIEKGCKRLQLCYWTLKVTFYNQVKSNTPEKLNYTQHSNNIMSEKETWEYKNGRNWFIFVQCQNNRKT